MAGTLTGFLVAAVAATGLAACSEEDDTAAASHYVAGGHAIGFSAAESNGITRAAGELSGVTTLRDKSFGVFASYTGTTKYRSANVSSDFMYNQQITWDSETSKWTYEPRRFWPANKSHYVSFFAYAPYTASPSENGCIADFSDIDEGGDPWLLYQLAENPERQLDLLYGVNSSDGQPMTDRQDPGDASNLTFRFDHALACVGDEVTLKCSEELKDLLDGDNLHLYISKVIVTYRNLTAKGRFYLNPARSDGQWHSINSSTTTTRRDMPAINTTELDANLYSATNYINKSTERHQLTSGKGLFYIPMHQDTHPQEAYVTVSFKGIQPTGVTKSGTVSGVYTLAENPQRKESLNIVLGRSVYDVVKPDAPGGGEEEVWSGLTFEAPLEGGDVEITLNITNHINYDKIYIKYSTDEGRTWYTAGADNHVTVTLSPGQKMWLKGTNTTLSPGGNSNTKIHINNNNCYIYGNIMSLLDEKEYSKLFSFPLTHAFYKLFENETMLINHPDKELVLPATELTENCYQEMFKGCTNLTRVPELPATKLARRCYSGMFEGCTSLEEAKLSLPATTMEQQCYYRMFFGCTSLRVGPSRLPATTLASECYEMMFQNCSNLRHAPLLPAETLVSNCYRQMFYGCEVMTDVVALFTTDPLAGNTTPPYTYNWLYGVHGDGQFYYNPNATWQNTSTNIGKASGIPSGWTKSPYSPGGTRPQRPDDEKGTNETEETK